MAMGNQPINTDTTTSIMMIAARGALRVAHEDVASFTTVAAAHSSSPFHASFPQAGHPADTVAPTAAVVPLAEVDSAISVTKTLQCAAGLSEARSICRRERGVLGTPATPHAASKKSATDLDPLGAVTAAPRVHQ